MKHLKTFEEKDPEVRGLKDQPMGVEGCKLIISDKIDELIHLYSELEKMTGKNYTNTVSQLEDIDLEMKGQIESPEAIRPRRIVFQRPRRFA